MSITEQTTTESRVAALIADGAWGLDPARSSVAFHVRHFYGLMTVKGEFADYEGTLDLSLRVALDVEEVLGAQMLVALLLFRVQAGRLDRQLHRMRFISDSARLDRDTLHVRGELHAAGRQIPIQIDATAREIDGELEIEAATDADHRELGMTWSPLGNMRAPSKLVVRGRLVRRLV